MQWDKQLQPALQIGWPYLCLSRRLDLHTSAGCQPCLLDGLLPNHDISPVISQDGVAQ